MTPQQVMDLSSAIKQPGNITELLSSYHDFEGNPKPEYLWPSEEDWKEWYPWLFSQSSNESQPQRQQVDSLSESEDEEEREGIIQSEEETAEAMSSYESEDNQEQILADTPLSIHDSPFPADDQDTVATFPAPPDPTEESSGRKQKAGEKRKVQEMTEDVEESSRKRKNLERHKVRWRDKVPREIKAQGPEAKLAYRNALKTGKVKVYRARIMLIGQDRAGKTSLKKSFLGLPFDPEEDSTDGIEVDPSKFEVDIDQVKNWKRTDKKLSVSQFALDLAKMVAKEIQERAKDKEEDDEEDGDDDYDYEKEGKKEKAKKSKLDDPDEDTKKQTKMGQSGLNSPGEPRLSKMPVVNSQMNQDTSRNARKETKTAAPAVELNIDANLPPEEFTDYLDQMLKGLNLQTDATAVEHHMILDLWDFAGQQLYYASYPVFLSPRAVYMLVYDLSKGLNDPAQPCFKQGDEETPLGNPNKETNMENLLSWLVSVSSICSSESEKVVKGLPHCRPPVFIVGTHADIYKQRQEEITKIKSQIEEEIIKNSENVIRPIFSVDNTQGSSDSGVSALQKCMIEVLKQEPYMGEEIPIRWFNFEKVVKALVAKKVYYLNMEQLQTIIQKHCFIENTKEVVTMLNFYHDLGVIVKHGNTVILQSEWLIKLFKQLITLRKFDDMEPRHCRLWEEMKETGALNMELVEHVFSKFCQQGVVKEDILKMMMKFGLIVSFALSPTEEKYFVPCHLRSPSDNLYVEEPSPEDPCPLYLDFQRRGYVPHGLYLQLVSRCTKWCSTSGFKEPPELYDGASLFFIGEELTHQMILVCKKRFIKIVLRQIKQNDGSSCEPVSAKEVPRRVQTFLIQTMQNLPETLPWFKNVAYELCVKCPYCLEKKKRCVKHGQFPCHDERCLCLETVKTDGSCTYCRKSHPVKILPLPELKRWFSSSSEDSSIKDTSQEEVETGTVSKKKLPTPIPQLPDKNDYQGKQILQGKQGQEQDKTIIHQGILTSAGIYLDPEVGGVLFMFPPFSVSTPTSILVHRWKHEARSPPRQEHEEVVSSVIEITTNSGQALDFNVAVQLFLCHSAPDLAGYEVVIKKLVDTENNIWEDVDVTKDLRNQSDIGGYPSLMEVEDLYLPVAQTDISECSTYAVVCRLKSSPLYTITSFGGSFKHPDYPDVAVAIPENAVPSGTEFSLQLQVQELPSEIERQGSCYGPVLRINCSQVVNFLKPVTIYLPVSLRGEPTGIPNTSKCHVRVLFRNCNGKDKKWSEITSNLRYPAQLDGKLVSFLVDRFSSYGIVIENENNETGNGAQAFSERAERMALSAFFFAFFRPDCRVILVLICCPGHFRREVIRELKKFLKGTPSQGSSKELLRPLQDKAFVFLSGGIQAHEPEELENYLVFYRDTQSRLELWVRVLDNNVPVVKVEFRTASRPTDGDSLCTLYLPIPTAAGFQRNARPITHDEPLPVDGQETVRTVPSPHYHPAEVPISVARGFSHDTGLLGVSRPRRVYPRHYSSPYSSTHHHSGPSAIFTPGRSLARGPYPGGSGMSTVQHQSTIPDVPNLGGYGLSTDNLQPQILELHASYRTPSPSQRELQPHHTFPDASYLRGCGRSTVTHLPGISGRSSPFGTIRPAQYELQPQSVIPGDPRFNDPTTSSVTHPSVIQFPSDGPLHETHSQNVIPGVSYLNGPEEEVETRTVSKKKLPTSIRQLPDRKDYQVKEGITSNVELEYLSVEVKDWEKLGRRLGFTPSELTALDKDKEKWSEKAYAMLLEWKQRKGSGATYRCLYDALSHDLMNRKDLAEEFCCWCSKSYTADPMLAEASLSTTHGSSHGLLPHVQHSEHYASPNIHTHRHSATSTIFTSGGSLATDPYLISGPGPSTVTQDEPIDEELNLPSSPSKAYDEQVSLQEESSGRKQNARKKRKVQEITEADPMLAEASLSTTHGSSHGLVPQVQYSEHYASPDIHTHHHSATSTIFTPGGSLATDPYLISGPGPSTVTQDEPVDEEMWPQSEIQDLSQLERFSLKERDTRPCTQDVPSYDHGTAGPVPVPLHSAGATIRTQTGYLPQRGMQDPPQQRVQPQNTMQCDLNLEGSAVTYPQGIPRYLHPEKISGNSTRPRLHQPQPQSASPRNPHRGNQKSSVLQLPEIPGNSTRPRLHQPQPQSASPHNPHRGDQKSSVPQLPEISGNSTRPRLHQPQLQSESPRNPHRGDQKSSVPQLPEISGNSTRPRTAPTAAAKCKST